MVHLASKHTHADMIPNLNEFNPGLGCRIDYYEFGVYHSSIDTISAYAVRDWMLAGNFGLFAGLATGYDESITVGGLTPMLGSIYKGDVVTLRASPMAPPISQRGAWGWGCPWSCGLSQPYTYITTIGPHSILAGWRLKSLVYGELSLPHLQN